MSKYKQAMDISNSPAWNYYLSNKQRSNLEKQVQKVLKTNKIKLNISMVSGFGMNMYDNTIKLDIYYNDKLFWSYPDMFFGQEETFYRQSSKAYSIDPAKSGYFNILRYVKTYLDTPVSEIINLPDNIWGLYEVLMMADHRLSKNRLLGLVIMIKSSDAIKLFYERCRVG